MGSFCREFAVWVVSGAGRTREKAVRLSLTNKPTIKNMTCNWLSSLMHLLWKFDAFITDAVIIMKVLDLTWEDWYKRFISAVSWQIPASRSLSVCSLNSQTNNCCQTNNCLLWRKSVVTIDKLVVTLNSVMLRKSAELVNLNFWRQIAMVLWYVCGLRYDWLCYRACHENSSRYYCYMCCYDSNTRHTRRTCMELVSTFAGCSLADSSRVWAPSQRSKICMR